ncbi:unnamed protein product [Linum trigynum]|uniref:Receptor-like serine/threonine-protein kinase n=1 Tax=Linum trigynum TaxID=586398 RepID=A0AAV2C981_9ROSI
MALINAIAALLCCLCFPLFSATTDIITPALPLRDGDTISSPDGTYEMGFFSPGSSKNRYFGIWYKEIPVFTVVWVANREKPITPDSSSPASSSSSFSGILQLTNDGILVIRLNSTNSTAIWTSTTTKGAPPVSSSTHLVAQLLNSGNLIVKQNEIGDENPHWQSFDYPGDAFLAGMKLGRDLVTGLNRPMTSWKSPDDPSQGNYSYGVELGGYPELVQRENSMERFRTGPWNGVSFSGTPHLKPNLLYTYEFVFTKEEAYYIYYLRNTSVISMMKITPTGLIQRYTWLGVKQGWMIYLTAQNDNCDRYAVCGAYGSCDIESSPSCSCLKGFVPRVQREWDMVDWTSGCVRKTHLNCLDDGFVKYSGVKLPEMSNKSWFDAEIGLEECRKVCLRNCSCTAYSSLDIRNGGSGCLIWYGDLLDIRQLYDNGEDLYVRMARSEIDEESKHLEIKEARRRRVIWISVGGGLLGGVLFVMFGLIIWAKRKKVQGNGSAECSDFLQCMSRSDMRKEREDMDLPLFDLATIVSATNNFSDTNVLGQGGFGTVYKGILRDGVEIAVKRLAKDSLQGADEFKNEAMHIAKLQHRNLVRLLGCCLQRDERMLVYEFMSNKSLDVFIFDSNQSHILDWPKRHNIVKGIARGILYLHQDSRLRIIHRDLKADNVLLDHEMNPKISDFGLARTFAGNVIQGNTRNVVGTYGYMSPEYTIDGIYSIKSDVFSFGVMVLEILSGQRNRGFSHPGHELNLLGHAWSLQREGRGLEVIDATLRESWDDESQVLRLLHIGLLCVQKSPDDRPSMSLVVDMLSGHGGLLEPNQPGFFAERDISFASSSSSGNRGLCTTTMSVTLLQGR